MFWIQTNLDSPFYILSIHNSIQAYILFALIKENLYIFNVFSFKCFLFECFSVFLENCTRQIRCLVNKLLRFRQYSKGTRRINLNTLKKKLCSFLIAFRFRKKKYCPIENMCGNVFQKVKSTRYAI